MTWFSWYFIKYFVNAICDRGSWILYNVQWNATKLRTSTKITMYIHISYVNAWVWLKQIHRTGYSSCNLNLRLFFACCFGAFRFQCFYFISFFFLQFFEIVRFTVKSPFKCSVFSTPCSLSIMLITKSLLSHLRATATTALLNMLQYLNWIKKKKKLNFIHFD